MYLYQPDTLPELLLRWFVLNTTGTVWIKDRGDKLSCILLRNGFPIYAGAPPTPPQLIKAALKHRRALGISLNMFEELKSYANKEVMIEATLELLARLSTEEKVVEFMRFQTYSFLLELPYSISYYLLNEELDIGFSSVYFRNFTESEFTRLVNAICNIEANLLS